MSKKITVNDVDDFIQECDYDLLRVLRDRIESRMKRFLPIRINVVYKRCGKEGCTCSYGDLEEYGHGPYLYAVYKDRDNKRRQRSLGAQCAPEYFEQLRASLVMPRWFNFRISEADYKKLSDDRRYECYKRYLSSEDFQEHYGISEADDNLDRPRSFYFDSGAYDRAITEYTQQLEIAHSDFVHLGLCDYAGLTWLKGLLSSGYYLAE